MTSEAMRRAGAVVGLGLLMVSLVVGTDFLGAREAVFGSAAPPPRESAFSRVSTERPPARTRETVLRSSPWWQGVETFQGDSATTTPRFALDGAAIQWRVKASCERGRLVVRAPSVEPDPLVDASCPDDETVEATKRPPGGLHVTADGPWRIRVEQQVDTPLDEPPLAAMSAPGSEKVATGSFYRIDQVGKGRLTVYRLPDGRYALRLTDFYVTPNIDLEIRLSPLRAPRSTRQFRSAPSRLVRFFDVTAGTMNIVVPRGVDPTRYRSVVIWCQQLFTAYSGATLRPGS